MNLSATHRKLTYAALILAISGALLIAFLSVRFLLFAKVSPDSDARNGLEVFGLLFFGFPLAGLYIILNRIFTFLNKDIYRKLGIQSKRESYYIYNFIAIILVNILLGSIYNNFLDNLLALFIMSLLYGLVITCSGLYDLFVTYKAIWDRKYMA